MFCNASPRSRATGFLGAEHRNRAFDDGTARSSAPRFRRRPRDRRDDLRDRRARGISHGVVALFEPAPRAHRELETGRRRPRPSDARTKTASARCATSPTVQCTAKIFLITGMDERTIASAEQYGLRRGLSVVATLQKPFDPDELLARFEKAHAAIRPLTPADLEQAIANGELVVHYQPIVRRLRPPHVGRRGRRSAAALESPGPRVADAGLVRVDGRGARLEPRHDGLRAATRNRAAQGAGRRSGFESVSRSTSPQR